MIVVADTSALFAAFDEAQREHADAAAAMERETLMISPFVLTELDHLAQRDLGFTAAMAIHEAITARIVDGRYKLAAVGVNELQKAHDVRNAYADLRLDLADSVGVVLADRHDTDRIFTLDHRDYRAVSPLTKRFSAFHLLPADDR